MKENDTEERILKAAETEFFTKGFDGARTTSIAERAGVTHAMLHYYFRSKALLFERVVNDKTNAIRNIIFNVLSDDNTPLLERIRRGVERHFDIIAENPMLPLFLLNEVAAHPDRSQLLKQSFGSTAAEIASGLQTQIDMMADNGQISRIDARMLILDIVSLNVFAFISLRMVNTVMPKLTSDIKAYLEMRKKENVEIIMRRLKP